MKLIKRIKDCKVHSLMYVLGTALAVCYVMLVVIPLYMSVAPVYPEKKRWNTYTIPQINLKWPGQDQTEQYSEALWYEILNKVKTVDNIAMVGEPTQMLVITTDKKHDKQMTCRLVSPNAFQLYEFEFTEGRPFTWEELEKGEAGVVLTEDAAKALFGEGEKAVGKMVGNGYSDDKPVVGVVKSPTRYAGHTCADIYWPMNNWQQLSTTDYYIDEWERAKYESLSVRALRLFWSQHYTAQFAGTAEQAEAVGRELDALCKAFNSELEAQGEGGELRFVGPPTNTFQTEWGSNDLILDRNLTFAAIIVFLLLIPVMSLVSLVNWRMTGRLPEMAVRRAFGATRHKLLKDILLENLWLTCVGGVLGLVIAWAYVTSHRWLMTFVGAPLHTFDLSLTDSTPLESVLSPWIFLVAFLFCVIINLASAFVPVWKMLRKTFSGVQSAEGCRHTMFVPGPFRLKELWHNKMELLKVFLIALASWFMMSAGLVLLAERWWPGKFDTGHYAVLRMDLDPSLISDSLESYAMDPNVLLEQTRRLPEVAEATILMDECLPGLMTHDIYLAPDTFFNHWTEEKRLKTYRCWFTAGTHMAETMRLTPIPGSPSIEEMERTGDGFCCILSRSAAMHTFGTTDVVGRTLWEVSPAGNEARFSHRINGVVEDVGMNRKTRIKDVIYCPFDMFTDNGRTVYLLLRLKGDVNVEGFCERYNQQDRGGRVVSNIYSAVFAQPLDEYCEQQCDINSNLDDEMATVSIVFLLLNLLLGMVGTFWIRTRGMRGYIGVMRAFGASRRRIILGLLAEGWLITVIAFALASAIILYLNHGVLPSHLSTARYAPIDWLDIPWQSALVGSSVILLILLLTVTLGIIVPAWMATREDITESIRQE